MMRTGRVGRLAPSRSARLPASRWYPLPVAEIAGGEVSWRPRVVSLGRVSCGCTYHESGTQAREGRDHVASG